MPIKSQELKVIGFGAKVLVMKGKTNLVWLISTPIYKMYNVHFTQYTFSEQKLKSLKLLRKQARESSEDAVAKF